jgi:hypothetical protein
VLCSIQTGSFEPEIPRDEYGSSSNCDITTSGVPSGRAVLRQTNTSMATDLGQRALRSIAERSIEIDAKAKVGG